MELVGKKLGSLTAQWCSDVAKLGGRPTVKVILYDQGGQVALFRSHKGRLGFVGGGVEWCGQQWELPARALLREVHEEVRTNLSLRCLEEALVVAAGIVPSKRDDFQYKALVICGVQIVDLASLQVIVSSDDASEVQLAGIWSLPKAIQYIHQCKRTKGKDLYCSALRQLIQSV